jgi:hypothetical protein
MAVCNKTGAIAVYNPQKNLFMSPLADGPLKFVDSLDGKSMNVEHITKYGRSFSIVKVPYVFKLLMQELQAINIKMCIITEDNINQFDNMKFSKNISLLTHGSATEPFEVVNITDRALKNLPSKLVTKEITSEDAKEPEAVLDYQEEMEKARIFHKRFQDTEKVWDPEDKLFLAKEFSELDKPTQVLKMGDIVMFNGDPYKNNRLWKITNEHEDGKFVTIQTNDSTGFNSTGYFNPNDLIRVVNRADLQKTTELYQMSPEDYPRSPDMSPPSMGGGGQQPMVQQPMFQQPPPININLVNGNNNKTEPIVTSGGSNGMPLNEMPTTANMQSAGNIQTAVNNAVPDIDSFLSKPMINRPTQEGGSNALDSLGNGKVSFVVKKI